MYETASVLGNEPVSLIPHDDLLVASLRESRAALDEAAERTVVISARCDLLTQELHELHRLLLSTVNQID